MVGLLLSLLGLQSPYGSFVCADCDGRTLCVIRSEHAIAFGRATAPTKLHSAQVSGSIVAAGPMVRGVVWILVKRPPGVFLEEWSRGGRRLSRRVPDQPAAYALGITSPTLTPLSGERCLLITPPTGDTGDGSPGALVSRSGYVEIHGPDAGRGPDGISGWFPIGESLGCLVEIQASAPRQGALANISLYAIQVVGRSIKPKLLRNVRANLGRLVEPDSACLAVSANSGHLALTFHCEPSTRRIVVVSLDGRIEATGEFRENLQAETEPVSVARMSRGECIAVSDNAVRLIRLTRTPRLRRLNKTREGAHHP